MQLTRTPCRPLHRERLREADDSVLRRRVGSHGWNPGYAGGGAKVHDSASSLRDHHRASCPAAQVCAREIDVDATKPVLERKAL